MKFNIITIFPEIFNSYFNEGIISRAQKNKIINIKVHNLRDWTTDKHKTVDDTPYGGGAGMVMKIEPIVKALLSLRGAIATKQSRPSSKNEIAALSPRNMRGSARNDKIILLSAKGKKWDQQMAEKYSKLDNIILICGRYEGVDERVKKFVDEEISIGDYVLTGGEIPAMTIVDSIARLLPGVLGNAQSAKFESHSIKGELEYPQYTRPEVFHITHNIEHVTNNKIQKSGKKKIKARLKALRVPKILLSGDHKKIEEWRTKKKKRIENN